jgi:hypothetical protein
LTEKMIEAEKNEHPNALKAMHLCEVFSFTPGILYRFF